MTGIPTIGPKEIQFRSKIEAQWAYLFESFKWEWEYEPYELNGYIPDFIIKMNKVQVLIEIKGDNDIWKEYKPHLKKIRDSGWKGHCIILGSTYNKSETHEGGISVGIFTDKEDVYEKTDDIIIRYSGLDWDFGGEHGGYDLDFSVNCWEHLDEKGFEKFEKMWSIAKNLTQWKGKQNLNNKKDNKIIQSVPKKTFIRAEPEPECQICQDTRISYWSSGCYGACMECSADLVGLIPSYNKSKTDLKTVDNYKSVAQKIYKIANKINNSELCYKDYVTKIIEMCENKIYIPSCEDSMLLSVIYNQNYPILSEIYQDKKYKCIFPYKNIGIEFCDKNYIDSEIYKLIKDAPYILNDHNLPTFLVKTSILENYKNPLRLKNDIGYVYSGAMYYCHKDSIVQNSNNDIPLLDYRSFIKT